MSHDPHTDDAVAVEAAALRLLADREHGRRELTAKLRRRGHADDLIAQVLDDLVQRKLLSEERFAEAFVQQRVGRGYGPLRVRAELSERGIAADLVEQALQSADVDWQALLLQAAERRFGCADPVDRRELAKRARHLQQRGFPPGMVGRYLDGLRLRETTVDPFD